MRHAVIVLAILVLASGILSGASKYDWAHYDSRTIKTLSGRIWTLEILDGVMVVRIRPESPRQPTMDWVVALDTPNALMAAGLREFKLGMPVEAIVWRHKQDEIAARARSVTISGTTALLSVK